MGQGPPAADLEIDVALVRGLLREQCTDLAELPLRPVAHGWDNAMFRLGESLCVRIPRRALGAELILHEQRYLPLLGPRLPIPTPVPLRFGRPGAGYPWHWSVVPWLPGEPVECAPLAPGEATRLSDCLLALHAPGADGPRNRYRGVPLQARADDIALRIAELSAKTDLISEPIVSLWQAALAAPVCEQDCWLHGDLHGNNVLAVAGQITALIDWGDLCVGDPATDLAGLFSLIDDDRDREAGLAHYLHVRGAKGLRARTLGWAIAFGTLLANSQVSSGGIYLEMGRAILRRVGRSQP